MPLFKLRFAAAGLEVGGAAANLLTELAAPRALAVTLFEDGRACFLVEAYYETEPSLEAVEEALSALRGGLGAAALEAVPDQNWVALSQTALPPIAAGRYLVHGSHDRSRVGARRSAIEIEGRRGLRHGPQRHDRALPRGRRPTDAASALYARARSGLRHRRAGHCRRARPSRRPRACRRQRSRSDGRRARQCAPQRRGRPVHVIDASGFGHPLLRPAGAFDLVLANLLPGPLIALAPALRRALRPAGIAVLSGLLDHQAREVGACYRAAGFHLLARSRRAGWTVLTMTFTARPSTSSGRRWNLRRAAPTL